MGSDTMGSYTMGSYTMGSYTMGSDTMGSDTMAIRVRRRGLTLVSRAFESAGFMSFIRLFFCLYLG
jgi:hypothetical protein